MKDKILRAAARLFAEQGYDGTAIQAVADAVGIRKASLLYYFPSKESLRQAVLGNLLGHWAERIPLILESAPGGHKRVDNIVREVVAFFGENPERARLLLREMLDRPDEVQMLLLTYTKPWIELVIRHIEEGRVAGNVYTELDPEAYIVQLMHLILGSTALRAVTGILLTEQDHHIQQADAKARQIKEIIRIAHVSMFVPKGAHPQASKEKV